jgi:hypothetical protein
MQLESNLGREPSQCLASISEAEPRSAQNVRSGGYLSTPLLGITGLIPCIP